MGKIIEIGEAKVTSKGQITVPAAVRAELGLATGDRVRFVREQDGSLRVTARKRRSILDIARSNPIHSNEPIGDLDAVIDKAVDDALRDRELRSRGS